MKTINACKLNCPQPLMLTMKALEEETNIVTIVDNDIAKQNIIKYCNKEGLAYSVEEKGSEIYISINKDNAAAKCEAVAEKNEEEDNAGKVYLIGTNILGRGSDDLGKLLMKGFIYTISQTKPYPKKMVFLNSGVKLACEGSDSINDLKELLQHGTEIVSCGTCLDFYQLKDKVQAGEIGNMYDIVETITNSKGVITI